MISCKAISSGASAANYHIEKNGQQSSAVDGGRAEYYQKDEVRSSWGGTAAALAGLGIGKEVGREDFVNVLDGKLSNARTGEIEHVGKMATNAQTGAKEWIHRSGHDFTFSAPKSVSIQSEVFGAKDMRDAHEKGVQAAMDFLERHAAKTSVHGQSVDTGNLLYAKFEHSLTRELDPQTHTHVLIANATYHDGEWRALRNEQLLQLRTAADAVYKNEMAGHLQSQGYRLEYDGKGNFEVAAHDKAQLDQFSGRSAQIDEALRAKGLDPRNASYEARQAACLGTRQGKDASENAAEQRTEWQERAREAGILEARPDRSSAQERDPSAGSEALRSAIAHLGEREASWSLKDLYKESMRFSEGKATYSQVETAVKNASQGGDLIKRADGKFTTANAIQAEKFASTHLDAGKGQHMSIMTAKEFDKAVERYEERKTAEARADGKLARGEQFSLKEEQKVAAAMILTGSDRFQGVQGLAGTGKTVMLDFVREAAESKGWMVEGHSNNAAQAQVMENESHISTTTTARHLLDQQQAQKDTVLAKAALETFDRHKHSIFGAHAMPDRKALAQGIKNGSISIQKDSTGRVFFREGKDTWTKDLYSDERTAESANLNHAGLTSTTYVLGKDGTVYKQGGTLLSEAAGALRGKIHDATRGNSLGAAAAWVAKQALGRAENWQKAGTIEGLVARVQIALKNTIIQRSELGNLRAQAGTGEPQKILRIQDEAGLSGQRTFNEVLKSTEQAGARTVFLGDKLQHQGVEAGKAFELAQGYMPTAKMEEIARQKTDHAKEAVGKVLAGNHAEAIKGLPTVEFRGHQAEVEKRWARSLSDLFPLLSQNMI